MIIFLFSAAVGTMFALPWYLTWFGHSLNQYKDVVRLYDFFLASPENMSIYVATSLVIQRRQEVFAEGCDMASIHCLLSQIPNNLNFDEILQKASEYYRKFPPEKLEQLVKKRVQKEYVPLNLILFVQKMFCFFKNALMFPLYLMLFGSWFLRTNPKHKSL